MRKIIVTGLVATMLIAGTLAMTGCSCSSSNNANNTTTAQNASSAQNATNAQNQTANQQAAQPQEASIVGNYKLIEKTDDGVTLNEAQLAAANKGRNLEVRADGTATKTEADGGRDNYTYDASKFIESDGDQKPYTFDATSNTLRITDGDDIYVYQKL